MTPNVLDVIVLGVFNCGGHTFSGSKLLLQFDISSSPKVLPGNFPTAATKRWNSGRCCSKLRR